MHPSRRSLPFPLNCQLVRVGTADYGGVLDQVSESRVSEGEASSTRGVCFGNEGRCSLGLWLARGFTQARTCAPALLSTSQPCAERPRTLAGRARGLLPHMAKELLESALAALRLSTCSSHPGWADICMWTLGSKGF